MNDHVAKPIYPDELFQQTGEMGQPGQGGSAQESGRVTPAAIVRILKSYESKRDFYVHPEIPSAKLRNASEPDDLLRKSLHARNGHEYDDGCPGRRQLKPKDQWRYQSR